MRQHLALLVLLAGRRLAGKLTRLRLVHEESHVHRHIFAVLALFRADRQLNQLGLKLARARERYIDLDFHHARTAQPPVVRRYLQHARLAKLRVDHICTERPFVPHLRELQFLRDHEDVFFGHQDIRVNETLQPIRRLVGRDDAAAHNLQQMFHIFKFLVLLVRLMKESNALPELWKADAPEHEDDMVEFFAICCRQVEIVVHIVEKHVVPILEHTELALKRTHEHVENVDHHRTLIRSLEKHTERSLLVQVHKRLRLHSREAQHPFVHLLVLRDFPHIVERLTDVPRHPTRHHLLAALRVLSLSARELDQPITVAPIVVHDVRSNLAELRRRRQLPLQLRHHVLDHPPMLQHLCPFLRVLQLRFSVLAIRRRRGASIGHFVLDEITLAQHQIIVRFRPFRPNTRWRGLPVTARRHFFALLWNVAPLRCACGSSCGGAEGGAVCAIVARLLSCFVLNSRIHATHARSCYICVGIPLGALAAGSVRARRATHHRSASRQDEKERTRDDAPDGGVIALRERVEVLVDADCSARRRADELRAPARRSRDPAHCRHPAASDGCSSDLGDLRRRRLLACGHDSGRING